MNDLVAAHRALQPSDPRSDEAITSAYASSPDAAQYAAGYPTFAAEAGLTPPAPYQPTISQEFSQGVSAGVEGLAGTAYGLGALGSAAVGAQGARDYFLAKSQDADAVAAENPPTIPDVSTAIQSPSNAAHYLARKAGEIAPNVAQAALTGAAGAVIGGAAGGAVEPVGGEVPGALGGALYGILESQATKALIEKYAAQGVVKVATDIGKAELAPAIKGLASNYGAKAAEVLSFWGQSAGSTYSTLAKNPDVDPQTAINVAILGGLAQAVPAAYLPSTVLSKFFGEGAASQASYFARLAEQGAKIVPGGAAAMSMQELAAIASEKYADPKTRDEAFDLSKWSDADKSRLLESSVTGGLMGLGAAPFAAIPRAKANVKIDDVVKNYTGDISENEKQDLATLAAKELTGQLGLDGKQLLASLNPQQKNAYSVIKDGLRRASAVEAPAMPKPSDSDIAQALEQFKQASQPAPVAPLGTGEVSPHAPGSEPPPAATPAPSEPPPVAPADTSAIPAPTLPSSEPTPPKAAQTITNVTPPNTNDALARARARAGQALSTEAPRPVAANPDAYNPERQADVVRYNQIKELTKQSFMAGKALPPDVTAEYKALQQKYGGQPPDASDELIAAGKAKQVERNAVVPEPVTPPVIKPVVAPTEEPSRVIGEKVIRHEGAITPDIVSADHPFDTSERKADYFPIMPEEAADPKKLGADLVSGAAHGEESQQTSRRVTVVQDNETGKVYALTTFADKKAGVVRIADPELAGKHRAAVPLADLLGKRGADDKAKYTPIASIKLTDGKNALVQEFASKDAYYRELGDPAIEKIKQRQSETRTLEEAVPTSTPAHVPVETTLFTPEHAQAILGAFGGQKTETELPRADFENQVRDKIGQSRASVAAMLALMRDAADSGLDAKQSLEAAKDKIYDLLTKGKGLGEETGGRPEEAKVNPPANAGTLGGGTEIRPSEPVQNPASPAGLGAAEQQREGAGGSPVVNPATVSPENQPGIIQLRAQLFKGLGSSLNDFTRDATREQILEKYQQASALLKAVNEEIAYRAKAGDGNPKDLFPLRYDADKIAGVLEHELMTRPQGPAANPDALRYRQPSDAKPTDASARHAQLLDTIHKAALDAGLNVTRIGQDISGLAGEFAKRTGASYDSASRTIAQVVGDVIGKEDVITSLHEVAHAVFSQVPQDTQRRILAAVDSLSDRRLAIDASTDPRIRQSNPDALPPRLLSEERLAESTALSMQQQGFDPMAARGLAQQFVRALKDLYLRAAMSVQRSLFGDSFVNPELATRFFQNKVEAFLAGDFTKRSFIDMLGGGKPSEAMQGRWRNVGHDLTFERINKNGDIDYGNIPNSSLAAAEFNNLKFRRPSPPDPEDMHSRQVEIEKQAARFNLKQTILDQAVGNDAFKQSLEEGEDASKKMLGLLGLTSPREYHGTLSGVLEQDGKPVQFDAAKTIDGFKAKSNAAAVTADAYRDVQSDLSKVSQVKTDARADVEQLTNRREKLLEAHNEAEANYTDVQYSTSVATRALQDEGKRLLRDTSAESKRLGSIAQQLKAIDPTADLKKYSGVFQKLFTGDELKGEKLYTVLDTLANDPKIDFSKSIVDIRQQMLAQGDKYAKYVQHTPESRALTAAIVSFAKTHGQIMANLELRKLANGAERTRIATNLADLKKQGVSFVKSFRDLPKTAILEDRAKQAYRKSLSKVVSSGRRIELAKQKIIAADAMAGVLAKHEAMLAGKLDIGAESVFRDGMPYNVPPTPDASTSEILAATKELKLDTSTSDVTSPEEVESDLRQMRAFLDAREAKYAAGDFDAKDSVYQGIKRQFEQIAGNKNFNLNTVPAQRFLIGLSALPDGKKLADGIGTPAARRVDQRMNAYTADYMALQKHATEVGQTTFELEDRLLKLVPAKKADAREWMRTNFLNPAKDVFHHSDDLAEKYADNPTGLRTAILNRVMSTLLNQRDTMDVVRGHEAEWCKGLDDLLAHQAKAAQWQLDRVKEAGLGVLDPSLKTRNPATGQAVPAVRQHISKGPSTFPQRMASGFRTMVGALRGSGWASSEGKSLAHEDFSHIGAAIDSNDEQAARQIVDKYFQSTQHGDQVRNEFFKAIAESQKESLFPAPLDADGVTRPPVDVALQHQAYQESGGDPLKFAQRMWELHDGQEIVGDEGGPPKQTRGSYIQSVMSSMADTAQEAHRILSSIEPDPARSETAIKGMSANALIDARFIAHLPSPWFDYHSFDPRDMYKTVERIAAERAFGRQQSVLDADVRTVANEVQQAQLKFQETQREVMRSNPEATGKVLKKLMVAKLGQPEYNRLEKVNARADLVPKFVHGVSDYFRKDNAPDGTLRVMTRASHLLGQLMINQPSSALTLMTQLVDMNLRFGSSKAVLGQTIRNLGVAGKEVAGSLLNAVGVQLKASSDNQLWNDLGLGDPAGIKKFSDIFDRLHGESPLAHTFRAVGEAMDTGVGKQSPFTAFRPAGIFNWAGQIADKAITIGVWNLAKGQMAKGVEFYRNNLEHFQNPDFKLDENKLGLRGADKDTFQRMTSLMQRWGLNYDDMVRGAMTNPDKIGLSQEQAVRLYSMAVSEIALASNLSTMPTHAYNNSVIRFALPLLGWSFRRMAQVGQIGLNTEGQRDMKALARGLAGLTVTAAGGLATTALIDQYYQTALGKQRNLRPLTTANGPQDTALSVMENLNRVGTLGLFGELANSVVNVGQGGDNRIASVDQRVLAISALQSIQQAASAWINQGFNADYSHVVRPLAGAVGGGGLIQYLQLANHALSLDNAEARVTARINAQNYLRVVGRELGLDVRESSGGGSFTPTPVTPFLTQMELASYKNSPGDFREAYQHAIDAAKAQGHDDPVAYIRSAFESRNPLRSVFSTAISESDYRKILAALPGSGASDVSQAVSLFNQFSASIGGKAFDGKKERVEPKQALNPFQIRQRAALALSSP